VTLQRRLEGVYRQYGARRPDVAFATAEVLRSALYSHGRGGSVYFAAANTRPPPGFVSSLVDDVAALSERDPSSITYPDAVAFYFREFLGRGRFYSDDEPTSIHTKYDKLVPWVAKSIASVPNAIHELLRGGALDRIADWAEATRPDIMRLTVKQAVHRERRWHAGLARERKTEASRAAPGEIVMRFDDGWSVQKLLERAQLVAEGEALGHCVGGAQYASRCAEGLIEIYSLRDSGGVPRYTVEIFMGPADQSPRLRSVRQVKGLKNKRPKLTSDCAKLLTFVDQLDGIRGVDTVYDLEHCLRKSGRWISDIRDIKPNRRTSRRRTSRRVA
jgi:predicted transcriptional regulator